MTHNDTKDKCDNCKTTESRTFWDYDDGSVLCDECHTRIGDEWYENMSKGGDEKETHHKSVAPKRSGMKKYMIGGAIAVIVLILAFSAISLLGGNSGQTYTTNQGSDSLGTSGGSGSSASTGDVQNAKLALVDFSYKLTPNKLVIGKPVRIEVDAGTLSGCMKTVVIRDFGVQKYITAKDNIIEFTPTKTGTFWITCSMGMGPGSFEVVNADGTSDPSAQLAGTTPPAPTHTCGAGATGGCGCGG